MVSQRFARLRHEFGERLLDDESRVGIHSQRANGSEKTIRGGERALARNRVETSLGEYTRCERLGIPYIELDALHWEPNWTEAPDEVMRERVRSAISGEAWVVDGNYSAIRDLVWARADTVVWLDLPLPTILARYARRTIRRLPHELILEVGRMR